MGTQNLCLSRNPWARLVSFYEHLKRGEPTLPPFSDWLYTVKPYGPGGGGQGWERYRKYGTYSIEHYIKDNDGNILADKVMRLEDINEKLVPFLTALNIPVLLHQSVPHKNKGGVGSRYPEYYSTETAEHVRHLYHYDIAHYGYKFGA